MELFTWWTWAEERGAEDILILAETKLISLKVFGYSLPITRLPFPLFINPSMPFSSLNLSHLWPELMRTLIQMKTNWEDVKAFLHLKGFSRSSFVQVCTPPDPSLAFPNPSLPCWPSQIIPWGNPVAHSRQKLSAHLCQGLPIPWGPETRQSSPGKGGLRLQVKKLLWTEILELGVSSLFTTITAGHVIFLCYSLDVDQCPRLRA